MYYPILMFCCFFLYGTAGFAQALLEISTERLDIQLLPSQMDADLPDQYQDLLDRRVQAIFTRNGVLNTAESTFSISPSLDLIDRGQLSGIQTLQTVQLELSLVVENIFSQESMEVFTKVLSGAGKTEQAAIKKTIANIRPSDAEYARFIKKLNEKIARYYENECRTMIDQARQAMDRQNYDRAVSLLYALPASSDCRQENEALLDQAFTKYQESNCQGLIRDAEVAVINKDFKGAIALLSKIDPASSCADAARQTLAKINQLVDAQTAQKLAFLNKVYSDNKELQKARQESMKAISKTYIQEIEKD